MQYLWGKDSKFPRKIQQTSYRTILTDTIQRPSYVSNVNLLSILFLREYFNLFSFLPRVTWEDPYHCPASSLNMKLLYSQQQISLAQHKDKSQWETACRRYNMVISEVLVDRFFLPLDRAKIIISPCFQSHAKYTNQLLAVFSTQTWEWYWFSHPTLGKKANKYILQSVKVFLLLSLPVVHKVISKIIVLEWGLIYAAHIQKYCEHKLHSFNEIKK